MSPELFLLVLLGARLTPLQADIAIDHLLAGRTQDSIASEYHISPQRVRDVTRRAREKMEAPALAVAA